MQENADVKIKNTKRPEHFKYTDYQGLTDIIVERLGEKLRIKQQGTSYTKRDQAESAACFYAQREGGDPVVLSRRDARMQCTFYYPGRITENVYTEGGR